MAGFTCIVTSQVFVEIWMRWSITLSSAFYRGRKHLWIVFSFKPHSPRVEGKQCNNQLEVTSNPFYQVQGQMTVCDVDFCDFVCWAPSGIHMERIKRDEHFLRYVHSFLKKLSQLYGWNIADTVYNNKKHWCTHQSYGPKKFPRSLNKTCL